MSGIEVAFTGIHPRGPNTNLPKDSFTTLTPNASFDTTIDVADVHDVVEGGTYKVFSAGRIRLAAAISTSPNTTELAGSITYQSNTIDLSISSVAIARRANPIVSLEERTKIQSDCTGAQDTALKQALTNVEILAFRTAGEALNGPAAKFNEYFKTTERGVRRVVADRLRSISSEASTIDSGVSTHFCTDQYGYCDSTTYAYTFPRNSTVANVSTTFHLSVAILVAKLLPMPITNPLPQDMLSACPTPLHSSHFFISHTTLLLLSSKTKHSQY